MKIYSKNNGNFNTKNIKKINKGIHKISFDESSISNYYHKEENKLKTFQNISKDKNNTLNNSYNIYSKNSTKRNSFNEKEKTKYNIKTENKSFFFHYIKKSLYEEEKKGNEIIKKEREKLESLRSSYINKRKNLEKKTFSGIKIVTYFNDNELENCIIPFFQIGKMKLKDWLKKYNMLLSGLVLFNLPDSYKLQITNNNDLSDFNLKLNDIKFQNQNENTVNESHDNINNKSHDNINNKSHDNINNKSHDNINKKSYDHINNKFNDNFNNKSNDNIHDISKDDNNIEKGMINEKKLFQKKIKNHNSLEKGRNNITYNPNLYSPDNKNIIKSFMNKTFCSKEKEIKRSEKIVKTPLKLFHKVTDLILKKEINKLKEEKKTSLNKNNSNLIKKFYSQRKPLLNKQNILEVDFENNKKNDKEKIKNFQEKILKISDNLGIKNPLQPIREMKKEGSDSNLKKITNITMKKSIVKDEKKIEKKEEKKDNNKEVKKDDKIIINQEDKKNEKIIINKEDKKEIIKKIEKERNINIKDNVKVAKKEDKTVINKEDKKENIKEDKKEEKKIENKLTIKSDKKEEIKEEKKEEIKKEEIKEEKKEELIEEIKEEKKENIKKKVFKEEKIEEIKKEEIKEENKEKIKKIDFKEEKIEELKEEIKEEKKEELKEENKEEKKEENNVSKTDDKEETIIIKNGNNFKNTNQIFINADYLPINFYNFIPQNNNNKNKKILTNLYIKENSNEPYINIIFDKEIKKPNKKTIIKETINSNKIEETKIINNKKENEIPETILEQFKPVLKKRKKKPSNKTFDMNNLLSKKMEKEKEENEKKLLAKAKNLRQILKNRNSLKKETQ